MEHAAIKNQGQKEDTDREIEPEILKVRDEVEQQQKVEQLKEVPEVLVRVSVSPAP